MKKRYNAPIVFFALSLLSCLVAISSVSFFPTGAGYNIPILSTILTLAVSGLLDRALLALGLLSFALIAMRAERKLL